MRRLGQAVRQALRPGGDPDYARLLKWLPAEKMIARQEAWLLARLVRAYRPQTLVEVGSYAGASTCVLAAFAEVYGGGTVYAIDPFYNVEGRESYETGYEAVFDRNVAPFGPRVVKVRGLSWEVPWERPIDLLFLDGDHSYDGLAKDLAKFLPLLQAGGVLVFHDYKEHGKPGVRRNVDEKIRPNPDYRLIEQVVAMIAFERVGARGERASTAGGG